MAAARSGRPRPRASPAAAPPPARRPAARRGASRVNWDRVGRIALTARPRRRPLLVPEPGDRLRQDLHGDDRGQSPAARAAARKHQAAQADPVRRRPDRDRPHGPRPGHGRRRRDPGRRPRPRQLSGARGPLPCLASAPTSWEPLRSPLVALSLGFSAYRLRRRLMPAWDGARRAWSRRSSPSRC